MQYVSDKPRHTVRGRVVYDRKLHPWTKAAVTRITRRFIEDNRGWVEEYLLPFFYEITSVLLEVILSALGLSPALARSILSFLVEQANKVMLFLFGVSSYYQMNGLAWTNFRWLVEPFMTTTELAMLGDYLSSSYGFYV